MAKRNRHDKKQKIAFSSYTKGGRISTIIALCSLIIFIATVVLCIVLKGKAGIYVGLIALLIFGLSMTGFYIGLQSYNEDTKFLKYTYIGTISNAIIWFSIICIYLIYV